VNNYSSSQYHAGGRSRWAVYCASSRVWYFPKRYGRKAAERYAAEMNAQDRAYTGQDAKFNAALAAITREGR
jgi:hypothetical protein